MCQFHMYVTARDGMTPPSQVTEDGLTAETRCYKKIAYLVTSHRLNNKKYSPDDTLIVRNIDIEIPLLFIVWNVTKYPLRKCYPQCFTSRHHLPPLK